MKKPAMFQFDNIQNDTGNSETDKMATVKEGGRNGGAKEKRNNVDRAFFPLHVQRSRG